MYFGFLSVNVSPFLPSMQLTQRKYSNKKPYPHHFTVIFSCLAPVICLSSHKIKANPTNALRLAFCLFDYYVSCYVSLLRVVKDEVGNSRHISHIDVAIAIDVGCRSVKRFWVVSEDVGSNDTDVADIDCIVAIGIT